MAGLPMCTSYVHTSPCATHTPNLALSHRAPPPSKPPQPNTTAIRMAANQKTPILIASGVVAVLAVALTGAVVFAKKGKGDGESDARGVDGVIGSVAVGGACPLLRLLAGA